MIWWNGAVRRTESRRFGTIRPTIPGRRGLVRDVTPEEKRFIAEIFKYSFVGIMLDWVKQGMKERPEVLVDKLGTALCGSVENSVGNFERQKRE